CCPVPTSRRTSSTTCAPAPAATPSSSPRPGWRSSTWCAAAPPTAISTRSACRRPPSPATAWPHSCRSCDGARDPHRPDRHRTRLRRRCRLRRTHGAGEPPGPGGRRHVAGGAAGRCLAARPLLRRHRPGRPRPRRSVRGSGPPRAPPAAGHDGCGPARPPRRHDRAGQRGGPPPPRGRGPRGPHRGLARPAAAGRARPGARMVRGGGAARRTPEGVDPAAARAQLARSVRLARDLAVEHGLEAILEPLHRGETDQINTLAEAVAFLEEHDLGDVRVVADLFHVMLEQESLETVRAHAGRVAHAHIADTARRPPGQGDWPLRAFLASLREGGYRGAVSIECVWQDLAAEAADALAALREADGIPAATAGQDHPAPRAVTGELVSVSPRPTTARTAVISRNGGWCWFQDERALVDPA